jgi:hypothetical protein
MQISGICFLVLGANIPLETLGFQHSQQSFPHLSGVYSVNFLHILSKNHIFAKKEPSSDCGQLPFGAVFPATPYTGRCRLK